ncbi:MAG: VOC family protein [Gammaproteobacteria bacterium]|nr:VOC family protein [Gammaproteobacteria bacterium]
MNSDLGTRLVPSLLAADLRTTIDFYLRLGFSLDGVHPNEAQPTWIALTRGSITLTFHSEPPLGTPTAPVCSGTFYFYPKDLDALLEEFKGQVAFAWGPEVMPYGLREFAIEDPNGYHLAFVTPA